MWKPQENLGEESVNVASQNTETEPVTDSSQQENTEDSHEQTEESENRGGLYPRRRSG